MTSSGRLIGRVWSTRIVRGSAANLFGIASTVLVQLASVPVLVAAFGVEQYGIWLLLSTIPVYIALSDLGLSTVATSEMTILMADKRQAEALTVYHTFALMVVSIFTGITCAIALIVLGTGQIDGLWPPLIQPHLPVIVFLTAYAAFGMISLVPVSALRATGAYAWGTIMWEGSLAVEAAALLLTAWLTESLNMTALVPALIRFVTMILMFLETRRLRPHFSFGFSQANRATARRLIAPALGALAVPVGLALNLQGTAIIVGALLGPAAVAVFVPVRTASRLAVQAVGVIIRAAVPEVAEARGRSDTAGEAKFWRLQRGLIFLALPPAALAFAVFGSDVVSIWTNGRIVPPPAFVLVMALTIVLHSAWFFAVTLLTASHEHTPLAKFIILACMFGLAVAATLAEPFGLLGVAASVVLVDASLVLIVNRRLWQRSRERLRI